MSLRPCSDSSALPSLVRSLHRHTPLPLHSMPSPHPRPSPHPSSSRLICSQIGSPADRQLPSPKRTSRNPELTPIDPDWVICLTLNQSPRPLSRHCLLGMQQRRDRALVLGGLLWPLSQGGRDPAELTLPASEGTRAPDQAQALHLHGRAPPTATPRGPRQW